MLARIPQVFTDINTFDQEPHECLFGEEGVFPRDKPISEEESYFRQFETLGEKTGNGQNSDEYAFDLPFRERLSKFLLDN